MLKNSLIRIITLLIIFTVPAVSHATTEYARQTGLRCVECHVDATGGGKLTETGERFIEEMKVKGLYKPLSKTQKVIRFFVGYVHMLTAIAWFGTILYVHILLKPAYAARGLPKGELFLGWLSIIILSVTGILLAISRIPSWEILYTTRFGILLSIKIILFMIMASTAAIVTFIIGPKLRKKITAAGMPKSKKEFTIEDLHSLDGKEGRPAYVAYKGKIYDVTASRLWKGGDHVRKHLAGHDLTDALKTAPHGEEKILSMPEAGILVEAGVKETRPMPVKIFYIMAYTNLVFVFLITFIIALWRWW
ncbi:MAG: cytochrome B5 [Nitrospirae bacterium GWC2_46_6]|nr:MAG: cytochrome B5 [Nitrospirae bacterium GWC2_46_6]OGW21711.1 MAG: cytochrome B5 [Nitrospirae bacterium GWA2_46_11]OGW24385.1 MAG: cytochrome B5 [Nitrospirae bacterium GWB2_47_37]HAK88392.1 cytochrome B5 [Nitrospiraceae bacterium]HCZ11701.1 cytochrome B5 [Nitrospiraceae bacterium]